MCGEGMDLQDILFSFSLLPPARNVLQREPGGDESHEDNPALPEKNKLNTKFGVA